MTFQLFTLPGVIDVADFNNDDKLGRDKDMVDRLSTLVSIFNNPALFPRGNCRVQIYELVEDAQILADPKGVTRNSRFRLMFKSWPTNLSSGGCY